MIAFTIRGIVREAETTIGIPGLLVKAYDEDLLFDDLLGSSWTDGSGAFQIVAEEQDFRDLFEKKPDVFFRILTPSGDRELHRTATAWDWSRLDRVEIVVAHNELGEFGPVREIALLGAGDDRPRDEFQAGEPLVLSASGLRAATAHDVIVRDQEGDVLFVDRLMTDLSGRIEPAVIWAQIGLDDPRGAPPLRVEDAQSVWAGQALSVELAFEERAVATATVRVSARRAHTLVLGTDAEGIPVNGFVVGERDAIVSLYRAQADGADAVRVMMVRRQHDWRVGDAISPVILQSGRRASVDVEFDRGQDVARIALAEAAELAPGAYDFILRPIRFGYEDDQPTLQVGDIPGNRWVTGLVVRERFMESKAVRGGCVNTLQIAGRSVVGAPYLQFTNVFQVGESVYGALDPAALDPNHTGKMVALYVVPHKTAAQWTMDSSLAHLPVLGGNPAVGKLQTQSYCVNANKRLLWPNASLVGEYDIAADFGNNEANAATFVNDHSFDTPLDLIDGYFVPGFRVVPDPGVDTRFAHTGSFQYDESTKGSVTVTDDFGGSVTVNVRAVVYFPADAAGATDPAQISGADASYPLFVVAHGNSSATNSYTGYGYLLQHFARNGFIAASIHLNPGMYALDRARVLLHHIGVVKAMFGSKAANNVGIMGHSRGGEAVVVAARLNQQEALGHAINSVISLAPTDWISSPTLGGAWATPYLVIYGSMDGDVAGIANTGFELYDRANGDVKSMMFVYGSTHGRYNTVWGDTDITAGWSQLGPTDMPRLINANAHQAIARAYMTAFCRQHQLADDRWHGMFNGEWVPASVQAADPGKVKLYNQYEDTVRREVDNFEGPHTATSWQSSTLGGAVTQSGLASNPQEAQLASIDARSPHDTGGLSLAWNSIGDTLRIDLPAGQRDVSTFAAVSFRVAQRVGSASNPVDQAQDLRVTLRDGGGNTRAVRVSKFGEVPFPHTRHNGNLTKSAMCTLRIPLTAYTIRCAGVPEVNLTNVESVTFEFSEKPTGEVSIDSVEFTN